MYVQNSCLAKIDKVLFIFFIVSLCYGPLFSSEENALRNSFSLALECRGHAIIPFSPLVQEQLEKSPPEAKHGSVAEKYLAQLTERSKRVRNTTGIIGLLGSGFIIYVGAALTSEEMGGADDIVGPVFLALGGILGGVSIWRLASPTREEKELKRLLSIENINEREIAGHRILESLARSASTGRIVGGFVATSFALGFLGAAASSPSGLTDEYTDSYRFILHSARKNLEFSELKSSLLLLISAV